MSAVGWAAELDADDLQASLAPLETYRGLHRNESSNSLYLEQDDAAAGQLDDPYFDHTIYHRRPTEDVAISQIFGDDTRAQAQNNVDVAQDQFATPTPRPMPWAFDATRPLFATDLLAAPAKTTFTEPVPEHTWTQAQAAASPHFFVGTDVNFDHMPGSASAEYANGLLQTIEPYVQPMHLHTNTYDDDVFAAETHATPPSPFALEEDDASVPGSPAHQQQSSPGYAKACVDLPPSPGSQGSQDSDEEPDGHRSAFFGSFGNKEKNNSSNNKYSFPNSTINGMAKHYQRQQPDGAARWGGNPQAQADAYRAPPTDVPSPAILTQTAAKPAPTRRTKRQREAPTLTTDRVVSAPATPGAQRGQDLSHLVTEQTYLEFHALVIERLGGLCSEDNPRNFKYLEEVIKEHYAAHPISFIPGMKNVKQKMKSLYTERRREKQLKSWRTLAEAAGIPKASRNVQVNIDADAVRANAPRVHEVMQQMFQNAAIPHQLVGLLADHVVDRLAAGYSCPSSILEMEPTLRNELLNVLHTLHSQPAFGTRFHFIHLVFDNLFAVADIEQAILASCDCESCVQDWELQKVIRISDPCFTQTFSGRKTVLEKFRLHWNRQKAIQFSNLLELHVNHNGAIPSDEVANLRRCRGWSDKDAAIMLPATHEKSKCTICCRAQRRRRSIPARIAPPTPLPFDLSLDGAIALELDDARPDSLAAAPNWHDDLLARFATIGLDDAPAMD